jgi:antitoxin VapB
MAIHIRDPKTDQAVRELARLRKEGLTDAIRRAVAEALERERGRQPLRARIAPLLARFRAAPKTGLAADKAFFDEVSGG